MHLPQALAVLMYCSVRRRLAGATLLTLVIFSMLALAGCGVADRWASVAELRIFADAQQAPLSKSMGIDPEKFARLFGRLENKYLAKPESFLLLPGVKRITASEAKVIGAWKGSLISLPQLEDATPADLQQIVAASGSDLCLGGLKDLSVPQAREIRKWTPEGRIFLTGPQSISPAAARELSQWGTSNTESLLVLDGVTSISPEAAQLLMHGRAWGLSLSGLHELDAELSKSFEAHDRPSLRLSGLTTIAEDARGSFEKWNVKLLWLGGIEELDLATAESIARSSNITIFLDGVRELGLDTAKALIAGKPSYISLLGVKSLSAEVKALLKSKANMLSFNTGVL